MQPPVPNQKYLAVLEQDDSSGCFTATVPDLPGCVSEGADFDDVLAMIADAVKGWLETTAEEHSFPSARRSYEELRAAGEIPDAAHVVPVSPEYKHQPAVRLNISADPRLIAVVDETAKAMGMNRSSFLMMAAREKLSRNSP